MEERQIDWKMLEWLIVSLWIDQSPTALQGDSRLAAAPFTPGALLVADSNLGEILSPMEETTLVHESGWSNLEQDLTYVPEQTTHTDMTPGMHITNRNQITLYGCL